MTDGSFDEDSKEELLGRLASEFSNRSLRGEKPSIDEYVSQFPQIADLIRDLFPALQALQTEFERRQSRASRSAEMIIGDFTVVREIGRGGMGIVYEAIQRSAYRAVALKILPHAASIDPRRLKRFQNEVRAIATLDHPHIVAIHSVGEEDGIHYYAMQLVRGTSLAKVIQQLRPSAQELTIPASLDRSEKLDYLQEAEIAQDEPRDLDHFDESLSQAAPASDEIGRSTFSSNSDDSPCLHDTWHFPAAYGSSRYFEIVAQMIADIAGALEHAHQHGIVHRDIKPANLLITTEGVIRVTDFGVARIVDEQTLSMSNELVGTLRYMAPEQAIGVGAVDHRADVYALGATLYELLTLQPTFTTEDRLQLLHQIANIEPVLPKNVDRRIPTDLQTIALKAMRKDPANRYPSALELQQDLQRFLEHRPIHAVPPVLLDHLRKTVVRYPWMSGLILVFLLSSFALTALMTNVARDAKQSLAVTTELLYASDMRTASLILEAGETHRALALLRRHEPSAGQTDHRDFVWHYLNRRIDRNEKVISTATWGPARWIDRCPDGRFFATGHESGAVVLWTSDSWQPIHVFAGHQESVTRVEFFPDSQHLLSADTNGLIHVWNLATHQSVAKLQCPNQRFEGLTITSDGGTVVVAADKQILLWDGRSPQASRTLTEHRDRLQGVAIAPDSSRFASIDVSNHLSVWSLPNGQVLDSKEFWDDYPMFVSIAFSRDSQDLFVGLQNGQLLRYNLEQECVTSVDSIHSSNIYSIELSEDGQSVLTSSKDMTIKLTHAAGSNERPLIFQHPRRAYCATFDKDGSIVSASRDDTIRIWPRMLRGHQRFSLDPGIASRIQLTRSATEMVVLDRHGYAYTASVDGTQRNMLPTLTHFPATLWTHQSNHVVLVGSETVNESQVLRDASRKTLEVDLDGDHDLDLIASLGIDGTQLEQERNGDTLVPPRLSREVRELSWRHRLLPSTSSKQASIWYIASTLGSFNVVTLNRVQPLVRGLPSPTAMDIADLDQDGTRDLILATSLDHQVNWYADAERLGLAERHEITSHLENVGDVRSLDTDHDGRLDILIACSQGIFLCRQQADQKFTVPVCVGKPLDTSWPPAQMRLELEDVNQDGITDVIVAGPTAVGYYLRRVDGSMEHNPMGVRDLHQAPWLTGMNSHVVVWDPKTRKIAQHFPIPQPVTHRVALTDDDHYLAGNNWNHGVSIFAFPTGQPIATIPPFDHAISTLTWSHDGRWLYIGSGDDIHVWDRTSGKVVRQLPSHENTVSAILVSHDNQTIASLSHDLTVRLWDTHGTTARKTLLGHRDHPLVGCFSPDDRILATMERSGSVYLWHVATGQLMMTLSDLKVDSASDLKFRDAWTLVATGGEQHPQTCIWTAKVH